MPETKTLPDLVAQHATRFADRIAIVHHDRTISYGQLWADVQGATLWLRKAGVLPGHFAGITVRDEYLHLVACLALLETGCSQVGLPSFEPAQSRIATAARLGLSLLIVDSPAMALPGVASACLDAAALKHTPRDFATPVARQLTECEPIIVFTSSGTTGLPKLVPVTQSQMLARPYAYHALPEALLIMTPVENNPSRMLALTCLMFGTKAVLSSTLGLEPVSGVCLKHGVTDAVIYAYHAKNLIQEAIAAGRTRPLLDGVRIHLVGSFIERDLYAQALEHLSAATFIQYGTMESGAVTKTAERAEYLEHGSVGRPLPGVRLEVICEDGTAAPTGTAGRIRFTTPAMVQAYLDDEVATRRHFIDGWFHPGDVGMFAPDGGLIFLGRADDMMNLNGIKIFPAEIEAVASRFPGVVEAAAFALKSPRHGDIPMLAYVGDATVQGAQLLEFCRNKLGVRAPKKAIRVEAIPRTSTGKPIRDQLLPARDEQA